MQRVSTGHVLLIGVAQRPTDAVALLQASPGVLEAQATDGVLRVAIDAGKTDAARLAHTLFAQGFQVHRLEEEKVNLETAFMRFTKGLVQ
jgi:uncharacterized membrane protein (DUF2068 family)